MSRNVTDHQPEKTLVNTLNALGNRNRQRRTLQPQGSAALRVEKITGYHYFDVPSGTIVPSYTFIDLESDNPDDIMIATLVRSTFMHFTDGTYINADTEDHDVVDDSWNVWMAYDSRDTPSSFSLDYAPGSTFVERIVGTLDGYSLPHHQARIGLRVNRLNSTTKPASVDEYLITYQIRAVIG